MVLIFYILALVEALDECPLSADELATLAENFDTKLPSEDVLVDALGCLDSLRHSCEFTLLLLLSNK